ARGSMTALRASSMERPSSATAVLSAGVSVTPGQRQFTRMSNGARSIAMDFDISTTAALLPLYVIQFGMAIKPLMEAMLTIDPPPCARIAAAAYLEQRLVPMTLTLRTFSQSARVASSTRLW